MSRLFLLLLSVNCIFANVIQLSTSEKKELADMFNEIRAEEKSGTQAGIINVLEANSKNDKKGMTAIGDLKRVMAVTKIDKGLEKRIAEDLFLSLPVSEQLRKIYDLIVKIRDAELSYAISKCNSGSPPVKCNQPYPKLYNGSKLFEAVRDRYDGLPNEEETLKQVTGNLTDIRNVFKKIAEEFEKSMKNEPNPKAYVHMLELSDDLVIPQNLHDIIKGRGPQDRSVNQTFFLKMESILNKAKYAVENCKAVVPKSVSEICGAELLRFYTDESYNKAWLNAEKIYLQRPLPASRDETTTQLVTLPTTTPKSSGDKDTKCCPVICLTQVPSCSNTNQCHCGCSSCNRGCRSQKKCCNCNKNDCCATEKSECCEKGRPNNTISTGRLEDLPSKSSSAPMVYLVFVCSMLANLAQ